MDQRYRWLEKQLDREDLTDEEFDLYNAELNALQDQVNSSNDRQKQERLAKEQARREELAKIHQMFDEGKVNELVEEYGQQFIGDYTITEKHEVLSFTFNERNPDQQKVWQCGSHEAAVKKLNKLLYYRVYDHYMRDKDSK